MRCVLYHVNKMGSGITFKDCQTSKTTLVTKIEKKKLEVIKVKRPIYEYNVVSIVRKNVSLEMFKGYVMIITNTGRKSKYIY